MERKTGKSKFTYRPFTLEGNFAFASGIQEMLLQSHTGIVRIFPAIPVSWNDVSFHNLRTYGAFLISAQKKNGKISQVTVFSEKGGVLRMDYPFGNYPFTVEGTDKAYELKNNIIELSTIPGQTIVFTSES